MCRYVDNLTAAFPDPNNNSAWLAEKLFDNNLSYDVQSRGYKELFSICNRSDKVTHSCRVASARLCEEWGIPTSERDIHFHWGSQKVGSTNYGTGGTSKG